MEGKDKGIVDDAEGLCGCRVSLGESVSEQAFIRGLLYRRRMPDTTN